MERPFFLKQERENMVCLFYYLKEKEKVKTPFLGGCIISPTL